MIKKTDQGTHDKPTIESVVMRALQVEGIDLEPTDDELQFFLSHQSTIGVEDILRAAQAQRSPSEETTTEIEEAYDAIVAMNRKNASNSFSTQTTAEIERKRRQLLEELTIRHEDAEG